MGRPTKLTEETQQTIVGAIQLGMYQEQAALLAGISPGTYYRWMEKGVQNEPPYSEFRDAVEKARAEAEARKLRAIHIAADTGTWQAAAWWLERSFPDRWGRRDRVEVNSNQKVEIVVPDLTADRLNMVLDTLADLDALPSAASDGE